MNLLIRLFKLATITHKTVAAIGATVVITAATLEYLRESNRRNRNN